MIGISDRRSTLRSYTKMAEITGRRSTLRSYTKMTESSCRRSTLRNLPSLSSSFPLAPVTPDKCRIVPLKMETEVREQQWQHLNKTQRDKTNNKVKHRPKVIREINPPKTRKPVTPKVIQHGKLDKTPKPATPSPATEKDNRSALRHYMSKRERGSLIDAPTVRRMLNFDSEGQAMDGYRAPRDNAPHFSIVYKRRRIDKGQNQEHDQVVQCSSKYSSFIDEQSLIVLDKVQGSEPVLAFGRIGTETKKTSNLLIQTCNPPLIGQVHQTNSMNQEHEIVSCNYSSLGQESVVLAPSSVGNVEEKNLNHLRINLIQESQGSSNIQEPLDASFRSQAIIPYEKLIDDTVPKQKYEVDSTAQPQNALVPVGGGGLLVPYKSPSDPNKKRRIRVKVDLDAETKRTWKCLMGKEPSDEADGSDMEKKWEEERQLFRKRAELFIARMHLVQGNRHFSKWKGSVVDSVVGVFLTQNVSDRLSSSAFMALVARFPGHSRDDDTEPNAAKMTTSTEQGEGSILIDDRTKWQDPMLSPKICDRGSMVTNEAEDMEENELADSNESVGSSSSGLHVCGKELEFGLTSFRGDRTDTLSRAKFQQDEKEADSQVDKARPTVRNLAQMQDLNMQATCSNSCDNLEETFKGVETVESKLKDEAKSKENLLPKKQSRAKKVKVKIGEKNIDWDSLRKEACSNGFSKERSNERMDSLDWEAVKSASIEEMSKTIRERGMNNKLAERIKDFLERVVRDHGSIDLEWLRDIPFDKAKDYLLSIQGLGLKSAECVRLLTLNQIAFPVDINVARICTRLGWVPLQPLPESLLIHQLEQYPMINPTHKYLWPRLCTLDQPTLYELHYQMITFGKVFCTKIRPNCNACPMRGDCKHFASAYSSARLSLKGPEEKNLVMAMIPTVSEIKCDLVFDQMPLPQLQGRQLPQNATLSSICQPIIEEPDTPEPEDFFCEKADEIPTIKLNLEESRQNLQSFMQANNMGLQDGDLSTAIVAITTEAASIPMPKLKNVKRLRTEHQVYQLPDSHPLLEGVDKREPNDPSPYLLAIWIPGETAQSTESLETFCNSLDTSIPCDRMTCFACNSVREAGAQTVRGTLLIPCRTALRGSFPLNGTYFQVNEVFADHDSSCNPILVPRELIWNLHRAIVYFGTSVQSVFRGLSIEDIQYCFQRGFICVRGFERTTRAPRPLHKRLHFSGNKKEPAKEE